MTRLEALESEHLAAKAVYKRRTGYAYKQVDGAWLTRLQLASTAVDAAVPVPVPVAYTPSGWIYNPASGRIADRSFSDLPYGLSWNSAVDNMVLEHLLFERCNFGLKLGASATAGAQSTGMVVARIEQVDCVMGAFLANISDSLFEDVHLVSRSIDTHNHAGYFERALHNIIFNRLHGATFGATGYCLNLYGGETSDFLTFNDSVLDASQGGLGPLTINWKTRDCAFNRTTLIQGANLPCIMVGEAYRITIDGFTAKGGSALIAPFGGTSPQQIKLRNGTWDGPSLPSFPWLDIDASVRLV